MSKPGVILRNFDTPEEEHALTVAETWDYSKIIIPKKYSALDCDGDFINSETISYYQNRYEQQQRKIILPKNVALTYTANVTYLTQLRVFNSPGGNMTYKDQIIPWYNITVVFCTPDNSINLATIGFLSAQGQIVYEKQSEYHVLEPEFDLNFSNCYMIELELVYTEARILTAVAEITEVRQIVVLDQNLVPILLCINAGVIVLN
jgi:hypothetical protein